MCRNAAPLAVLLLMACGKHSAVEPAPAADKAPRGLSINEMMHADEQATGLSGMDGDWLELHNGGGQVDLIPGEWFFTDRRDDLLRFELPACRIPRDGQLLFSNGGMIAGHSVVQLPLSFAGEAGWLALVHFRAGVVTIVDSLAWSAWSLGTDIAWGRYPDGTRNWVRTVPTPGGPNEESVEAY